MEKYFHREWEKAARSFTPASKVFFEQAIGLEAHIKREIPLFLTLRDPEGAALVTAMLPPSGKPDKSFGGIIIVGPANADSHTNHDTAIKALANHFAISLDRSRCYPYRV